MATTIRVRDETSQGEVTNELTLEMMTATVTAREIIRSRVYQEVADFNRRKPQVFRGLVQPKGAVPEKKGYRVGGVKAKPVDWEQQFERAVEAFQKNGFLLLVDNRQATDLDETIELGVDTTVSFVKLVPLVGG
ncbi:MAG: hypothetical protein OER88_04795 [Planctomycetota bacterium]|nr:hypothetical protein [Planctomycetota bacterium]